MISHNANGWDADRPSSPSPLQADGPELLQVALRRKWLLLLGLFVGAAVSYLVFVRTSPVYQSTAQMLIRAQNSVLTEDGLNRGFYSNTAAEDHAIVMASPMSIGDALQHGDLSDRKELGPNPTGTIARGLRVSPLEERSSILQLSFRGPEPELCRDVLQDLMDSYTDSLNKESISVEKTIQELLQGGIEELDKKIEVANLEHTLFRQDPENANLLRDRDGSAINFHRERQLQIEAQRSQLLISASELDAKVSEVEAGLANNLDPNQLLAIFENGSLEDKKQLDSQRQFNPRESLDQQLFTLLMQDELLASRYGTDHPQRKKLQRQIEFTKRFYAEQQAAREREQEAAELEALNEQSAEQIAEQELLRERVRQRLDATQQQLALVQAQIGKLDDAFAAEETAAMAIANAVAEDARLLSVIQRHEDARQKALDSLTELDLSDIQGEKYTINYIRKPGTGNQVEPNMARILTMGCIFGLLGGFGLAYLVEKADQTFRDSDDISTTLGLPLVGHIPEMTEQPVEGDSLLDPYLVAAHRPKSPLAEAFRGIRTSLYFNTRGKDHRVVQVTSPVPGDGKSTLIANLAISIAQSGKKVLLMDADCRRPTQHKKFGLPDTIGLVNVIAGTVDPPQAIQATEVANLSVMVCGPRPHNPSELLTSPEFAELLELLREQFDFVLVDTPPLLAVTDPSVVAARVDGVLLATRIRRNGRPLAKRAKEALDEIEANVFGVIVNGVDPTKGKGSYYGGYKSGYTYQYRYNYEEATQRSLNRYYDDEESTETTKTLAGR